MSDTWDSVCSVNHLFLFLVWKLIIIIIIIIIINEIYIAQVRKSQRN